MKKNILCIALMLCSFLAFSQTKKPTLMILPSDNWCTQRYFMMTFDNQGTKVQVPDYQTAFREDSEIGAVISKIGQLMTDLGYSLKDAEQEIKNLSIRETEVVISIYRWYDWEFDLDSDFNGESLIDQIQDWLQENTVNGEFNLTDATENKAQFEQVRIPVTNEKGRAVDARSFGVELQKYLKAAPFNIPSSVRTRGLGEVILILGEQ